MGDNGNFAVVVRPAVPADAAEWEKMRCAMWPEGIEEHGQEIAQYFAGTIDEPQAVLIAEDETAGTIGVAELSLRTDIPGFEGQSAGYVEGLYIRPGSRGRNTARRLLEESRKWASEQGCSVFASDRAERIIVDPLFSRRRIR
jgi:GNAT superfamily N-acetyltransferase